MADDWIKVRHALVTGPKVSQVRIALGCSRLEAVGCMVRALLLADEHADPDSGEMPYTCEVFDDAVGIDGAALALEAVGWVEVSPQGVVWQDFTKHNGQSAKRRASDAKRSEVRRASAKRPQKVRSGADEKRTECGPREEKRREEKRREEKSKEETKPKTAAEPPVGPGYMAKALEWADYRRKSGFKVWKDPTWKKAVKDRTPDEFSDAVDFSIGNGYQGLFDRKGRKPSAEQGKLPEDLSWLEAADRGEL